MVRKKKKEKPKMHVHSFSVSQPPKASLMKEQKIPIGELRAIVKLFPEATLNPTKRWYGETFKPQYDAALKRLRQLANI